MIPLITFPFSSNWRPPLSHWAITSSAVGIIMGSTITGNGSTTIVLLGIARVGLAIARASNNFAIICIALRGESVTFTPHTYVGALHRYTSEHHLIIPVRALLATVLIHRQNALILWSFLAKFTLAREQISITDFVEFSWNNWPPFVFQPF